MKKLIISILISFLVICSCFAEEFKFLGIPFDSSMKDAIAVMKSKGWTYEEKYSSSAGCFFSGKTYAGKNTENVILAFEDDKMFGVSIVMDKVDAAEILAAMINKYNLERVQYNQILYCAPDGRTYFRITKDSLNIVRTQPKKNTVDESEI